MAYSRACPSPSAWLSSSKVSQADLAVYTGISNRSRGWKSRRKFGDAMEGRIPASYNIKKWDGAAKACANWDSLRRDSELWYKDGNCYVHLYGKGTSRRGPSFKVPLSALLEANCHPLLNRYLLRDVPESPTSEYDSWTGEHMAGRVDLFIPPPPMSDRKQALEFHLAVRNFFAWLCRRSVVGEHLGSALVGLMGSMIEFRSPGVDNSEDIMSYLDEEGYLNMANQPIHALAMLHLAESFQIRNLYINAFAHCAGMADCLYMLPEYQSLISLTRKLLRSAQADLETKLSVGAQMLRNFLEDDLSESNLGLSAGGRAHLERFRTFLHSFYTHRMGYYPPSPIYMRSSMWEPAIYQRMRDDFEALYDFLVDKSFTTIDNSLYLGQGGICALQNVHTFDLRHKFKSLAHPLPLLPEVDATKDSRRATTLFSKSSSKLKPDKRLVAHAALVKATNAGLPHVSRNALVAAYKRFEEESVVPASKLDKNEKLSQVDARKIRWILIYCIYQTLRNCTEPPPEVCDTEDITYSVAISMADLLPWKETPRRSASKAPSAKFSILSSAPSLPSNTSASSAPTPSTPGTTPGSIEIKPDVDYFALTHRDGSRPTTSSTGPVIPPRSGSLSKAFTRSGSLRKSMDKLKQRAVAPPIEPAPPSRRSVIYHEIIVRGYGNGTHDVQEIEAPVLEAPKPESPLNQTTSLAKSPSTASNSSTETGNTDASVETSPCSETSWTSGDIPELTEQIEKLMGHQRRASESSSIYSVPDEICPPVPRRNSARKSLLFCDEDSELAFNNPDEWHAIEADVHERCEMIPAQNRRSWMDDEMIPEWDSFADVGGLTLPTVRE